MIPLALKCWLSDKSEVNKQQIRPALANTPLQKLSKINLFYSNITLDNKWEDFGYQSDPVLLEFLTDKNIDKNVRKFNNSD